MRLASPAMFVLSRASAFVILALAAVGCGDGVRYVEPTTPPSENQQRLNYIGDAYLRSTMRLNRAPKSVAELAPTFKSLGLKGEDFLKSADDGKPFEIVWGSDLRSLQGSGSDIPIVAFERDGKDGKRHVLRGRSEVLLMSESELRSGKFPDGYKLPF